MKSVIIIFVSIILLAISFCIGATQFQGIFNGVKWTDIGSLIVTFLGFFFAFVTYFQWLKNKRKEDSYLVAKKYVASIDEIEEQLHELIYQYEHICPAPGVGVESNDVSLKRIEHLHNVWDYLYQARRNLFKSHRELAFWNVSLVNDFKEHYIEINKSLDNISVVSSALNNQLFHYIKSDMKNMGEVISHKKHFDELFNEINSITKKQVECSFKDMFKFGE
ncbi:hypothetical protein JWG39_14905 [Desulforhopalus vacuolatus]|uniref:hypothetical protein n=1 Tax=Desulforhopalus vacuolatus TaxID=40414 RepID=UPI001965FA27|nr:hypothetical protein [Desulforhopalus vacuolatus]MBM9521109.1 hypothetical protein [Desulforhopalus vacuolatus]